MRPLLLLLACSACSLALDTDELRGLQDGGMRDAPIVDGGDRPDADVMLVDGDVPDATDSGPDGGCPELMPTEIFGETGGPLSVRFCTEATVVVACSASANGNVVNFELPVGDDVVELPSTFIAALPLFHEATVGITCFVEPVTLPIPEAYHSLEELEGRFRTVVGVGATVDIDDNGTVVFAGSDVTAPDQEADVFHWRVGDELEPLVERLGSVGGGLLAPRISDDGSVVTYNDAADRQFRAVNVADGTMGAVFPRSTASVSNDLRGDSAAGYQFVMREWQPEGPDVLAYRAFTLTDFVSGGTVELAMTDVNPTHPGRSPRLFDNGTASAGVSAVSSAAAGSANGFVVQDAAEPTAPNVFDECEVDVQRGLFASDGNRVALVGRCDGAISDPQFWLRASDGVAIGGLVVPDGIDGLLAVSDDFRYYLVRGDGGYRGIIRQISDGNFDARRLALDRRTFTGITLLSTAALSPNGQWAVLALNDGDRTAPHRFRIARVRVH